MKPLGVLDRYLLRHWLGTFVLSVVGVPAVAVLIDLSERFGKMVDAEVPLPQIFLGQLYLFPAKMAMLFPAGVLFATVFTLNAMGRHNELTAVKAGGVSFYRLILPMLILAALAVPANFEVQELASYSTTRQKELQGEETSPQTEMRFNFAFASPSGWTWVGRQLFRMPGRAFALLGNGPALPTGTRWEIAADSASWVSPGQWVLKSGAVFAILASGDVVTFRFDRLRPTAFTEPPSALLLEPKKAEEMTTNEMRDYLDRRRRAGVKPDMLNVDYPLKFAVPVACLVVALFGAPLAVTSPRAGAALGLAIALGTTLVYLTGTQIMKAVGGKGLVPIDVAAWSMNGAFLLIALVLLWRVRT